MGWGGTGRAEDESDRAARRRLGGGKDEGEQEGRQACAGEKISVR